MDLFSLFQAQDVEAFEKMNNAVAGVMKTTFDLKSYELQPIAPRFSARKKVSV